MTKLNGFGGKAALGIGHMAGMIDLAALPLWIGTLMKDYQLQPPQAGLTVTMFLAAVVVASVILAPRFVQLKHRAVASSGFAVAVSAFFVISRLPVSPESFLIILPLHAIAGLGAGAALSVTHGAIGRTANPHRLFGVVNVAMGVLAIAMFAVLPGVISDVGGQSLFLAFAITMATASIVALVFFPTVEGRAGSDGERRAAIPGAAWLTIGVVVCLALSQATVFSFVERIGDARQFGQDKVQTVLIVMGFINLIPGILAALLQNRLSPITVGIAGPVLQALAAVCLTNAVTFPVFAVPAAIYVTLVIFSHTFLFGLLSKIDPTGRAVAATPAMMMVGSAIGPVLGGIIVAGVGYEALGWAVVVISSIAVALMFGTRRELAKKARDPALAIA